MSIPTFSHHPPARRQRGTSLIEVLVTLVILAIGLLGVAGLQGRLHLSEMEGYQRAQAMILLNDMSSRLSANRNAAATYLTASAVGASACPTATTTLRQRDLRDWCLALRGSGEVDAAGNSVGTLLGGRGCIETAGTNEYLITVAWQGLAGVSAPNSGISCGRNAFDGAAGSACSDDRCRRVVTTLVKVAPLL